MYYWNFNNSSSSESFDKNKNHRAELTGGPISADQKYFVIEDQGKFLAENLSSHLSGENGFMVSFLARQTGRLNQYHFMPCKLNVTYASRKELQNSLKNVNACNQSELLLILMKLIEDTSYGHLATSD